MCMSQYVQFFVVVARLWVVRLGENLACLYVDCMSVATAMLPVVGWNETMLRFFYSFGWKDQPLLQFLFGMKISADCRGGLNTFTLAPSLRLLCVSVDGARRIPHPPLRSYRVRACVQCNTIQDISNWLRPLFYVPILPSIARKRVCFRSGRFFLHIL